MQFTTMTILGLAATLASAQSSISVTPHAEFGSSIGVLGCYINTNRVAYWPELPSCDNICVQVSNGDRSVNLLRIDHSGGAYDISYDAYAYLVTGQNATENPIQGGGVEMTYTDVPMSECADLLTTPDQKLAFSAANSIDFIASCWTEPSSWVNNNYALYNIFNDVCTYGVDEQCTLDLATSNDPVCPHQLGLTTPISNMPVYNIGYGTGVETVALA